MQISVKLRPEQLKLFALAVISKIRSNTLNSKDKDGKSFKSYSKRPFIMPAGAALRKAIKTLDKNKQLVWFIKGESEWILIKGGYAAYKSAAKPASGSAVNLSFSGQMLRDMTVINVKNDKVTIGWNRKELAERAGYNIDLGRDFLGLPEEDINELSNKLLGGVEVSFKN